MKSLDSGDSPVFSVRLSSTERAVYLSYLVCMNRAIETEDWLEISRPLALSAMTRCALRTFWKHWCEAQSMIADYFTGGAEFPVGTRKRVWKWVVAKLLFALVADEPCGIVARQFKLDRQVWIWCAWNGSDIQWGSVDVINGKPFVKALAKELGMLCIPEDPKGFWEATWAFVRARQCYSFGVPL
jgi:hypothetical protein